MDRQTNMPLSQVLAEIVDPGLAMLPMSMDTPRARLMLLAIGRQESRFRYRRQTGNGPARGFWQFEQGGGVKGVMTHSATRGHAHRVCAERGVMWGRPNVWAALESDDLLAVCFARLLLFSDPKPLPAVGDYDAAWTLYADRTWRPGKPHRETWNGYYDEARAALGI
ncbi:hypothetical protein [Variovorax saccharolyticus]|uniref:hypothetical protein n=1 Tax=Variovorax saccharolyticus TaxID=3053516 RepID=UPI00257780E2|nr:hypothetical protein [Variovorax sp. J31P216]MDM0024063.1 hypothetical protein [Variovorax sp. J31P216]